MTIPNVTNLRICEPIACFLIPLACLTAAGGLYPRLTNRFGP